MATPTDFTPGQAVFVHAFGSWYPGTVAKIGRSKVHVTYTSGAGVTRTKACSMTQVALEPGERRGAAIRRRKEEVRKGWAARRAGE
jgi:hypothetical protein